MMRLGFNSIATSLPLSFLSVRAAHSSAFQGKRSMSADLEHKTSAVAERAISDYANIFTREGDKVFIHTAIPGGKPPEKRMAFVKLYMYANHLIGKSSISLSDLTKLCNREGYKSHQAKGNKTSNVQTYHFKTALESNSTKNLFRLFKDEEDGKTQVALTDRGVQQTQHLAETLNSIEPEEAQGRLKDVLTIFKKEGFLENGKAIPIKKLGKACENNGYSVQLYHLRDLISGQHAKQLFVFDRDRDTVRLSPVGIKMVEGMRNHSDER